MRCAICGANYHTTEMHPRVGQPLADNRPTKLAPGELTTGIAYAQGEEVGIAQANAFERIQLVTLCGSTRFKDLFDQANMHFTMLGYGVLSCGLFGHIDQPQGAKYLVERPDAKEMLDRLHFQKIDAAEFIYIINPGGYVGESTKREIEYAKTQKKKVLFMFPLEFHMGLANEGD